jgi:DNA-binding response OmpR family regulator
MARVLVVDDDQDLLTLVEIQLRRHGHQVVRAASGPDALSIVRERGAPPEVAVLDVAMPEMNGFELLVALRGLPGLENLPVVFLSARVSPEDVDAGRALEAEYLTKPYVMSALLATISKLLDKSADRTGTW